MAPNCDPVGSHIVKPGQDRCPIRTVPYQAPDCSVAIYKRTRMRRIKKLHLKGASSELFYGFYCPLRPPTPKYIAFYNIQFLLRNINRSSYVQDPLSVKVRVPLFTDSHS